MKTEIAKAAASCAFTKLLFRLITMNKELNILFSYSNKIKNTEFLRNEIKETKQPSFKTLQY